MALINKLTDIAEAIRNKTGKTDLLTLEQMPTEIGSIKNKPVLQDKELTINENGTHNIIADEEYDGLNEVSVTVNAIEDLTEELTAYNNILNSQESTINGVVGTLQGKGVIPSKFKPNYISFYYFQGSSSELPLEDLDTSNITNMSYMFGSCSRIGPELDLTHFDTSNVNSMYYMFYQCRGLTSLNLSSWDTSKVANMSFMFNNCSSLQYLDIRNFDFTNVTLYQSVFYSVPDYCEIIVKDETAKAWVLARNSAFTNVKTVAELEAS